MHSIPEKDNTPRDADGPSPGERLPVRHPGSAPCRVWPGTSASACVRVSASLQLGSPRSLRARRGSARARGEAPWGPVGQRRPRSPPTHPRAGLPAQGSLLSVVTGGRSRRVCLQRSGTSPDSEPAEPARTRTSRPGGTRFVTTAAAA